VDEEKSVRDSRMSHKHKKSKSDSAGKTVKLEHCENIDATAVLERSKHKKSKKRKIYEAE